MSQGPLLGNGSRRRPRWGRAAAAGAAFGAVLASATCGGDSDPLGPDGPTEPPVGPVFVSEPVTPLSLAGSDVGAAESSPRSSPASLDVQSANSEVAYVSVAPGSFPEADSARLRHLTHHHRTGRVAIARERYRWC